ncbi:HNH endonuclease [Sphingomonas sp. RB56-2]|uniref:HNH endonuclease n=1 Tax=Sphingomonas brevis TaxID=2908206 RepID=A0ABT0SA30_9SPHN|nr:HNH endonuclease [Sphingomonas brevis]
MKRCFKGPIVEIFEAASLLSNAADAHLAGNPDQAATLLVQADLPAISAWTESIWGKSNPEIHWKIAQADPLPFLSQALRPQPRMPGAALQREIIRRDGYHCRFCGIPVVPSKIRQKLARLYPESVRWGRRNHDQHAALQCMWLQFDHLIPNQRGGASTLENLIITCAPCNFGRMEQTIEEVGLLNPFNRDIVASWPGFDRWDGLTRLF